MLLCGLRLKLPFCRIGYLVGRLPRNCWTFGRGQPGGDGGSRYRQLAHWSRVGDFSVARAATDCGSHQCILRLAAGRRRPPAVSGPFAFRAAGFTCTAVHADRHGDRADDPRNPDHHGACAPRQQAGLGACYGRRTGQRRGDAIAGAFPQILMIIRADLVTAVLAGFGRTVSEVGAVILVGGNIRGLTRTMTTAILHSGRPRATFRWPWRLARCWSA